MPVTQIKHADWLEEGKRLFGPDAKDWKFVCISCGTVQSAREFHAAGVKPCGQYLGFSCIGRWSKTMGCDWTLGGLFTIHTKEVIGEDGKATPVFEFAPPGAVCGTRIGKEKLIGKLV
jgi:hypothetical protein